MFPDSTSNTTKPPFIVLIKDQGAQEQFKDKAIKCPLAMMQNHI